MQTSQRSTFGEMKLEVLKHATDLQGQNFVSAG
jgi:hypothetical protein